MNKQFHTVNGILVNREITEVKFACDLNRCKGACCTLESEYGAPLHKEEIPLMQETLPEVLPYLPEEHRTAIEQQGFFEHKDNEYYTRSLNNKACLFVYYDNLQIARCAIEKAFFDGKVSFRKPVSCHLFPIRISDFGGDILRYERFSDCQPALANGKAEDVTIAEFCKDSLIRNYGRAWYDELDKKSKE